MAEAPWFKFKIQDWMMGRIQRESDSVVTSFLRICCKYWHKKGELTTKEARREAKGDDYMTLVYGEFISEKDGFIAIEFLDEQLNELKKKSVSHSERGKLGGKKSAEIRKANALKNKAISKQQLEEAKQQLENSKLIEPEEKRREEKRIEIACNLDENKKFHNELCEFFGVSEQRNARSFFALGNFSRNSDCTFEMFESYKLYKKISKEVSHGLNSWIGTPEEGFSDGAWCQCDWGQKIKSIPVKEDSFPTIAIPENNNNPYKNLEK